VRQLAAVEGQTPVLLMQRAEAATVGAGLLRGQGVGLLAEQNREGTFADTSGRGAGDVLHGLEIDLGAGSGIAEGASGDDFAPLGGEVTDFLKVFRGELARRHGWSCLVLTRMNGDAFLLPLYRTPLCRTKLFLASNRRPTTFSC
jgi:hypothetical protein